MSGFYNQGVVASFILVALRCLFYLFLLFYIPFHADVPTKPSFFFLFFLIYEQDTFRFILT
jgi:hypothetical protein